MQNDGLDEEIGMLTRQADLRVAIRALCGNEQNGLRAGLVVYMFWCFPSSFNQGVFSILTP
jgi:hypothetical protein